MNTTTTASTPTASASPRPDLSNPFQRPSLRGVITLFHCLAIVFTITRLARRVRIRRFSWDDGWAALCLILMVMYLACAWIKFNMVEHAHSTDLGSLTKQLNTLYKLNIAVYTSIVWFSRVSLSLSIARIFPQGRTHQTAKILSFACLVEGLILIIGKTLSCKIILPPKSKGPQVPQLACIGNMLVFFFFQIIGDIVSSVALVIFPIRALFPSTSDLRPSERRLILVLLASTLATLGVCLANAIYILKVNTFWMILFSDLEASVSLMVCNFLVVITSIWRHLARWFSRNKSEDRDAEGGGAEDGVHNNAGEGGLGRNRNTTTLTTMTATTMTATTTTTTSHFTESQSQQSQRAIGSSGSGTTNSQPTNTTTGFSTLTDIAELTPSGSLPSMPSVVLPNLRGGGGVVAGAATESSGSGSGVSADVDQSSYGLSSVPVTSSGSQGSQV